MASRFGGLLKLGGIGTAGWAAYTFTPDEETFNDLREAGVPDVAINALEFMTPDKAKAWLEQNVMDPEGLRNLASTGGNVAGVVASEAAEAAVQGDLAGKVAWMEVIGKGWNQLFGGDSGLGFINFFRKLVGLEPKQFTTDGLKTVEEIVQDSTPDMQVGDIPAAEFKNQLTREMNAFADPVTGAIDYSTENLMAAAKKADPSMTDEINGIAKTAGLTGTQDLYNLFNGLEGMSAANALNAVTDLHENIRTAPEGAKLDADFLKRAM